MDRILLFATILILCLGVVQYVQADACSSKTVCNDCLQEAGCQWCAAERMWANSTAGTRCRTRPERRDPIEEASWCAGPAGSLLDPPDLNVTRPQQPADLVDSEHFISPHSVVVNTRRDSVQLVFLVKLDVNQNKLDAKLQRKSKSNFFLDTPIGEHHELTLQVANWKLYTVKITVKATCGRHELRFRSGGRDVPVVLSRSCECDCGRAEIDNSEECGGRGALHCGGCECRGDWGGPRCEAWLCPELHHRGDMPSVTSCRAPNSDMDCSGAGVCRCNRECHCTPGGDYFDEYCSDFCSSTGACALCYRLKGNDSDFYYSSQGSDSALSRAHKCQEECYGSSIALLSGDERAPGAVKRVACSVVDEEGCTVAYSGWRLQHYSSLRLDGRNCSAPVYAGVFVGAGGVVGAVAGAVLGVALVGAVGAVLWRAAQRPGDVLSSMEYEHMDAEANQGENPLYKPPTSSYNNPTYQQTKK